MVSSFISSIYRKVLCEEVPVVILLEGVSEGAHPRSIVEKRCSISLREKGRCREPYWGMSSN